MRERKEESFLSRKRDGKGGRSFLFEATTTMSDFWGRRRSKEQERERVSKFDAALQCSAECNHAPGLLPRAPGLLRDCDPLAGRQAGMREGEKGGGQRLIRHTHTPTTPKDLER
jgi:hypothetical protein